jgi:SAM-dependent methyltransferase
MSKTVLKYFDDEGRYSYTRNWYSKQILEILKKLPGIDSSSDVIDCTCGLGGDTITFSRFFERLYSIELNDFRADLALKNFECNHVKNVHLGCGNLLDLEKSGLKFDLLYIDLPWSGKEYKYKKVLKIRLSGLDLNEVIAKLKRSCKAGGYLVFKLPKNIEKITTEYKKISMDKFDLFLIKKE